MGIKIWNTDISKIKIASGLTPRLPSAYQEVEYIESTGTQHINTGVIPSTQTYTAELDIASTKNGSEYRAFGIWWTTWFRCWQDSSWHWDTGFWFSYSPSTYSLNTKTHCTMSNVNSWTSTNTGLWLFAMGENGSYASNRHWWYKIYYCKIWNNWTLIRDFVPCYRIADSVIWMYDLVNDTFYINSWSWTFSKWADVGGTYIDIKKVYLGSTQVRPTLAPWERPDLDTYTLLSSTTLSPWFTYPHWIAVSWDGTKLYIWPASWSVAQYTMTWWLLSNIGSVESTSSSITTRWLYCKSDGTKLFSLSDDGSKITITMPTPFSFSWSSATNSSGKVGSQEPTWCWFTPDGDYYFICDWGWSVPRNTLYKIPLGTPRDFSTATTTWMTSIYLNPWNRLYNVAISPTWLKMFIGTWSGSNYIYEYILSTSRDITTATYTWKSLWTWGRATFSVADNWDIFVTDTDISTPTVYQYTAS